MRELTAARLREVLRYDPATGEFIRLCSTRRTDLVGRRAGRLHKVHGYVEITVDGKLYRAHRLAWLYMTGAWPSLQIDHRNRVRNDNAWSNLRDVSNSINQFNRGAAGVSQYTKGAWVRWRARVTVGGRERSLGYFDSKETAIRAYHAAKQSIPGATP